MCTTLYRYIVVQHRNIFLVHDFPEILYLAKYSGQTDLLLLQSWSIKPETTHHLVALHSYQGKGHVSPAVRGSFRRIRLFKILVIQVERELSIELTKPDSGSRSLGLAGTYIEKAELIPDTAPHMDVQRLHAVPCPIPMQPHTLRKANTSPNQS